LPSGCPPDFRLDRAKVRDQLGQSLVPHADVGAVRGNIDPVNQQMHDPRLLGREQLVPERVKSVQRITNIGFAKAIQRSPGGAPGADVDLG
jgi:hypothetical protein